jgi:hypothetical protein
MQQEQPQLYSTIAQPLSAEEQGVIQTAINQAEANAQAAIQLAAQAAQNPQIAPAPTNGGVS